MTLNVQNNLVTALQKTYRKHALGDDSIGWEELHTIVWNALCNALGDDEAIKWLEGLKEGDPVENEEALSASYAKVNLSTEDGCNPKDGEYSLHLVAFTGGLDITAVGGTDDVSLIRDCIENNFNFDLLQGECTAEIILRESGEWEDVFWNKYYLIENFVIIAHK